MYPRLSQKKLSSASLLLQKCSIHTSLNKPARVLCNAFMHHKLLSSADFVTQHAPTLKASNSSDLSTAYFLQDTFTELLSKEHGKTVYGWKIGCTSKAVQTMFKLTQPTIAPYFDLFENGAKLSKDQNVKRHGIEAEFAFQMINLDKVLLSNTKKTWTESDIVQCIESVHPVFEVIASRFLDESIVKIDVACLVADLFCSGGIVKGIYHTQQQQRGKQSSPEHWKFLEEMRVDLFVDDQLVKTGHGKDVLGSPINALVWFFNYLKNTNNGLQKIQQLNGKLISTGTCTGLTVLEKGQTAVARFGNNFGSVSVTFV
ncbi:putative hydratase [Reticulomyxa filosa]|uniref:Putative hydratase n=1 Tax=Reticulomyxa filosa TaxID=46433 RepID=X6MK29_RETFI|nr:putative hydratase [Reticulomyxa filosa]|eukprot:ETO14224.1 putative hydratase [Reticulomyxa filosa]